MIALVTASAHPRLCEDDQPLLDALADLGIDYQIAIWDDPAVNWAACDDVILRSPWDYPGRSAEFLAWYEHVARRSRVHNELPIVRRNQHKGYLVDLARSGVPVVPTVVVANQQDARKTARERGWEPAVLKPAIGLGGRDVTLFSQDGRLAMAQGAAAEWCVQQYLPSIWTEGEYSVVVIDGVIQHALVKRPGPHDFRVHDGRGGTHEPHPVTAELAVLTADVLAAFGAESALYARVDAIRREDGRLALMELDVTSPCLYTEHNAGLAAAFAAAVARLPHRVTGQDRTR